MLDTAPSAVPPAYEPSAAVLNEVAAEKSMQLTTTPATAATESAGDLDEITGLVALVDCMPNKVQHAALIFCQEQDLSDVTMIAFSDSVDDFISALRLKKAGGVNEKALRRRLQQMRA